MKMENKTALHLAAFEGQVEVLKYLLQNKADTKVTDDEGDTVLHFAAFGYVENRVLIGSFRLMSHLL